MQATGDEELKKKFDEHIAQGRGGGKDGGGGRRKNGKR